MNLAAFQQLKEGDRRSRNKQRSGLPRIFKGQNRHVLLAPIDNILAERQ